MKKANTETGRNACLCVIRPENAAAPSDKHAHGLLLWILIGSATLAAIMAGWIH